MSEPANLEWPLMANNVMREDLDAVLTFLQGDIPNLTQGEQVAGFEQEWSKWLGVKYSVFVNSGSSANLITMQALRQHHGSGEVIVPTLTWASDISAVLHAGFKPVFVDIDRRTLGMATQGVLDRAGWNTKGVFLTHVLGYNALTVRMLDELVTRGILLVEDVCESCGATFGAKGAKLGTLGLASNFSFYYAHHLTTVEGGMISTDSEALADELRMLRSHGLVRESRLEATRRFYARRFSDLETDFVFAFPAYNVRGTEIAAVIGRSQLKRLDGENEKRIANLKLFLDSLDPDVYRTDFEIEGNCSYALTLILKHPDSALWDAVKQMLRTSGVEYRHGLSGGGNQLRQPYLKSRFSRMYDRFPEVDHVHFYGCYVGNYPSLEQGKIVELCRRLNRLSASKKI